MVLQQQPRKMRRTGAAAAADRVQARALHEEHLALRASLAVADGWCSSGTAGGFLRSADAEDNGSAAVVVLSSKVGGGMDSKR